MMGQAKQRGSLEQRMAEAIVRNEEKRMKLFEAQLKAREERQARLKARADSEKKRTGRKNALSAMYIGAALTVGSIVPLTAAKEEGR